MSDENEHVDVDHVAHEEPQEVESNVVASAAATPEHVDTSCGGCGQTYGFDIDSSVDGFVYQCNVCKAQNAWQRAA